MFETDLSNALNNFDPALLGELDGWAAVRTPLEQLCVLGWQFELDLYSARANLIKSPFGSQMLRAVLPFCS